MFNLKPGSELISTLQGTRNSNQKHDMHTACTDIHVYSYELTALVIQKNSFPFKSSKHALWCVFMKESPHERCQEKIQCQRSICLWRVISLAQVVTYPIKLCTGLFIVPLKFCLTTISPLDAFTWQEKCCGNSGEMQYKIVECVFTIIIPEAAHEKQASYDKMQNKWSPFFFFLNKNCSWLSFLCGSEPWGHGTFP